MKKIIRNALFRSFLRQVGQVDKGCQKLRAIIK